jgi:hypothetical protein
MTIVVCVQSQKFWVVVRRAVGHNQKDRQGRIMHYILEVLTIWSQNSADVELIESPFWYPFKVW